MTFQQIVTSLMVKTVPGHRRLFRAILISLFVLGGQFALGQTFKNPIAPPLSADPSIVMDNGTYYFTSTDGRGSIDVQSSKSLATLGTARKTAVFNPCCGYEHPSLWKLRGNWFMLWDDGNGSANYGLGLAVFNGGDVTNPGAWTNRGKVFGTDTNTGVYGPGTTFDLPSTEQQQQ